MFALLKGGGGGGSGVPWGHKLVKFPYKSTIYVFIKFLSSHIAHNLMQTLSFHTVEGIYVLLLLGYS